MNNVGKQVYGPPDGKLRYSSQNGPLLHQKHCMRANDLKPDPPANNTLSII